MTENADKKVEKNPEVTEKATRRRFTADYKRRIALEAERCSEPGELDDCQSVSSMIIISSSLLDMAL